MSSAFTTAGVVDVHSHFVFDEYVAAAQSFGHDVPDNMPAWPTWSREEHLRLMDATGVARSMLSISSPGVFFGDVEAAIDLARTANDFGLHESRRSDGRLGLFGTLPLPDVGASISEAIRVLDSGAAGLGILSNAGGVYLGDQRYEPLWAELDSRRAIVFIHPTAPQTGRENALGRPLPMLEFVFDEARTVTDLIFSGVLLRFPHIRFVVTHSGGAMPVLVDRVEMFRGRFLGIGDGDPEESARAQFAALWFDSAGTPVPTGMATLAQVVGTDHLLYGSDYCFMQPHQAEAHVAKIVDDDASTVGGSWEALYARNSVELLSAQVAAR